MAADSVEREILIAATPEIVWGVITEPDQIGRWFSDEADVEARVGAEGTLTWRPGGRAGNKGFDAVVPLRVVAAEPFSRFAFRWSSPEGEAPEESNSALVEFSLTEEEGGTRLRVLESGIAAVAHDEQARARYIEDHARGWERHLGELRDYVAAGPRGSVR